MEFIYSSLRQYLTSLTVQSYKYFKDIQPPANVRMETSDFFKKFLAHELRKMGDFFLEQDAYRFVTFIDILDCVCTRVEPISSRIISATAPRILQWRERSF